VFAALTYSRFLLFAGIIITRYLARELSFVGVDNTETDRPLLNVAIMFLLAMFVAYHIPKATNLKLQTEIGYPKKALTYLQSVSLDGPMMNDFSWGGYLLWNMPQSRVFIDLRADGFEERGVFRNYMDTVKMVRPQQVLDKYRI